MATSTYTPLATTTLASAASSYTFSSIPATYTDLVIVANYAGFSATGATTLIQLNGDATTTRYSSTNVEGDGTSATSGRYNNATAQAGMLLGGGNLGYGTGQAIEVFHIMNYSNATTYKTVLSRFSQPATMVQANVGLYTQTTAISSVTILTYGGKTFSIGSTFSLYGISSAPSAKATGGMITSDATYYYHTFTSTGTFTPTQSLSAAILVVGGGGGSGYGNNAGSGGAGGYLEGTGIALTATAYTVTVGGGGTTSWPSAGDGTAGVDSSFGSIGTAFGGGRGSGTTSRNGGNGGSGGGGGYDGSGYGTGGTATQTSQNGLTGFGNNGGGGVSVAGGGGAGGAASGTTGGAGKTSSLMGGTYAVGATGGGVGPNVTPTQNTGNSGPQGSAGGSGIVIVRYAK